MMNKTRLQNIFRSRYFYIITLLSVWLLVQVFYFNVGKGTGSSLQLSSSTTSALPSMVSSMPASSLSTDIVKYYDVQFKILQDQSVSVVDSESEELKTKLVTLKKNSVVTVSVPAGAFGVPTDPTTIKPNQINIPHVVSNLETLKDDPPYQGRHEVIISSADRKNKALIGETARVSLSALASRNKLKIIGIEEGEEIDDEAAEDIYADEAAAAPIQETPQAGLSNCALGKCDTILPKNTTDILDWAKKLLPQKKTVEEMIADYEKSTDVQELMSTYKKGYSVAISKKRRAYVRVPNISRSYGVCYRGVKTLLAKAGIIESTTDLHGASAKLAGPELKKNGFINLLETEYKNKITSPNQAPLGSVIVYEGFQCKKGDRGCKHGHIEVRTETGFTSDYFSTSARTGDAMSGRGRRITGIYIKSDSTVAMPVMASAAKGTSNE